MFIRKSEDKARKKMDPSISAAYPSEVSTKMANSDGDKAKVPPTIWHENTLAAV